MRVTTIESVVVGDPWKNWVFALVHTDDGITGLELDLEAAGRHPYDGANMLSLFEDGWERRRTR